MTSDLIAAWAQRDRAQAAWAAFVEEARAYDRRTDPVLMALDVPVDRRSEEQRAVIDAFWTRRTMLLTALREAEREVRMASGHEKPQSA